VKMVVPTPGSRDGKAGVAAGAVVWVTMGSLAYAR
jgi:hypothetical protein